MSNELYKLAKHCDVASASQIAVLLALAEAADSEGVCWPSIDRIAGDTRLGRSTVMRALRGLEDDGYVLRRRRRSSSSVFTIVRDRLIGKSHIETSRIETSHSEKSRSEDSQDPKVSQRDVGKSQSGTVLKRTPKRTTTLSRRSHGEEYTEDFEVWWRAYPKRNGTRGSKWEAFKSWPKALNAIDADSLLAAVRAYTRSQQVADGFAKDAVTWLNQRCWEEFSTDLENPNDWLKGEWRAGRVGRIEERTGLRYPQPDVPLDVPPDGVERWQFDQCRNWIAANHDAILERLTARATA